MEINSYDTLLGAARAQAQPQRLLFTFAQAEAAAPAVQGRTLTSDEELADEVREAGGSWVNRGVQVDQKLLTGRRPEDLPAFCASLVQLLSTAIDERRLDKMVEQSFPASDPLPGPITLS